MRGAVARDHTKPSWASPTRQQVDDGEKVDMGKGAAPHRHFFFIGRGGLAVGSVEMPPLSLCHPDPARVSFDGVGGLWKLLESGCPTQLR
eukprot:scaffold645_cov336-Pavlova_lutheri.AAC.2